MNAFSSPPRHTATLRMGGSSLPSREGAHPGTCYNYYLSLPYP